MPNSRASSAKLFRQASTLASGRAGLISMRMKNWLVSTSSNCLESRDVEAGLENMAGDAGDDARLILAGSSRR